MSTLEKTQIMLELLPEKDIETIYVLTKKMLDEKKSTVFKPLTREEIIHDLETSSEQIRQGRCSSAEDVVKRMRGKYGL